MPPPSFPMQTIPFTLTDAEFIALNAANPASKKNADIGARAVEIVRLYAKQCHWTENQTKRSGVDLAFTDSQGRTIEMEVKGTAASGIQWGKLGVSGKPCYDNLTGGMPLYRVSSVYDKNPIIHVLKCSEDFTMDTEPRWKIKRKK